MMKVWLGCFDDLFSNWNVSHGCHLLIFSLRFLLCSSYVLPTLLYLQTVGDLGHSVQLLLICFSLYFEVAFNTGCIQYWVVTSQWSFIPRVNRHTTCILWSISPVDFHCLHPITYYQQEQLSPTLTSWYMIENTLWATLERLAYFECVSSCWRHQSVIFGNQNVQLILIWSAWYPLRFRSVWSHCCGNQGGEFK